MASNRRREMALLWMSNPAGKNAPGSGNTYKRGCKDDPWPIKGKTHEQCVKIIKAYRSLRDKAKTT